MDQKQQILHHYRVDEDGLREISRKVGVDRKTVRRLIQAFEERITKDPDLGIKACMEGFTVYFTSVQRLLTQIREAKAQKMLQLGRVEMEKD